MVEKREYSLKTKKYKKENTLSNSRSVVLGYGHIGRHVLRKVREEVRIIGDFAGGRQCVF